MSHVSRATHRVRSYELDSYGHVNNAVFLNWLDHGRSMFLQDKGLDYHNIEERWNVRFVTVSVKIDFRRQLGLGEEVDVVTTVVKKGRTSITLDQRVLKRDGEAAATSDVVIVFTDPGMHGAVPVPEEFLELYGVA